MGISINKKGQVLVMFIIMLPLMIMALALVVDLGLLMIRTYKVQSVIRESISYGLDNPDSVDEMKTLLKANLNDEDTYEVSTTSNIRITVKGTYKTVFSSVFKNSSYKYEYTYIGYVDNNQKVIKKE